MNRYCDLIDQTFDFPQDGFQLESDRLLFNDIDVYDLIERYGTPLKFTYLPKIRTQIQKARKWFQEAIEKHDYKGKYYYCYCTKSAHFKAVLEQVLKEDAHLETSSAFDIDLIRALHQEGKLSKDKIILNNGFKTAEYAQKVSALINDGFHRVTPICDNVEELAFYEKWVKGKCNLGLRLAIEEEPNFNLYTSRLGIPRNRIFDFYNNQIKGNSKFRLRMLHFFVDKGIRDNIYYWNELKRAINTYCELKKICPTLTAFNIGGGLPIRYTLGFDYDYAYMLEQIVALIKETCAEHGIDEPHIFTEFGQYTVGESSANIYQVLQEKRQNDREAWYMIDNSLITTVPDCWAIEQQFVVLPINQWNNDYQRVNIGGLTCDNKDYYNAEVHSSELYLPKIDKKEPLYIGFFHTGAYQAALSGQGGLKHCLIPSPKHILVDIDENDNQKDWVLSEEQTSDIMLKLLGF